MKIGLVCIAKSLNNNFKKMTKTKFENMDYNQAIIQLKQISLHNLKHTLDILKMCSEHKIECYRMTSTLIPLQEFWNWDKDIDIIDAFYSIKYYAKNNNIKLSFHVDHFCVLSSSKQNVIDNTIKELIYHQKMCKLTGADIIVMHVGSTEGGKEKAIERFKYNFNLLPTELKDYICLENDDKVSMYNILDILNLCQELNCKMVLDWHHHKINHIDIDLENFIKNLKITWKRFDRNYKIHLSSGDTRDHEDFIRHDDYKEVISLFPDADIMIEAKEKDLAIFNLIYN